MLSWVITFLVIALIAGILGFGGVAGASIEIAKLIFFIGVGSRNIAEQFRLKMPERRTRTATPFAARR